MTLATLLGCALALGCSQGPGQPQEMTAVSPRRLVDHSVWASVEPAQDPLAAHRPETVECGSLSSWGTEEAHLEVHTARCNYLMITQPSRASAAPGDRLTGTLAHFDLAAPEPATAHVAILVGNQVLFERTVPIPGPAEVFLLNEPIDATFQTGEPIYFHLHNHGQNDWRLYELAVEQGPQTNPGE